MGIFKEKPTQIDALINHVVIEMTVYPPDSPEYALLLERLERLTSLKAQKRHKGVSPDTLAVVAGNLLGVLVIVGYERTHVMTSRAIALLFKQKTI